MGDQEKEFVRIYLETGDEVMAVNGAYGKMTAKDAREHAAFVMNQPHVRDAIMQEKNPTIKDEMTPKDVMAAFAAFAKQAAHKGDFANANRAMENIGKILGAYVDRKEIRTTTVESEEDLDEAIQHLANVVKMPKKSA